MERFADFSNFLNKSPTPFHFTEYSRQFFKSRGYVEKDEREVWTDVPPRGFFIRDDRCLVAWNDNGHDRCSIIGTHCDSPCLIIKPNFEEVKSNYNKVRCATYGGGLWNTWIGRNLRLAGKVVVSTNQFEYKNYLFDSEKGIGIIPYAEQPPLAPVYNEENDLVVTIGTTNCTNLKSYIAEKLGVKSSDISEYDLRFVNEKPPNCFSGIIEAQRIDNLSNTYAALTAFAATTPSPGITNVMIAFDNEEIGSSTQCGAKADIIHDLLRRLIPSKPQRKALCRNSIILSADTAHATHPNYPNITDPIVEVKMSKGVCVCLDNGTCDSNIPKILPFVEKIAHKSGVGLNMAFQYKGQGGSTIGPISESRSGITTIDMGVPCLAMHSIREMCSIKDLDECVKFITTFYTMGKDEFDI
ncbi:Clan MH, family M18, aspartyl aminopeptidase-like metallopeptidase [Trichomonas vaginalis G3]|uniref:aspartyl aminopeptidase n=1 Tax=Trichomonas vaginalis (strain ATCC PRA-98 / G3) TaxID=412133 RepID=A2FB44_TRIV3|nr:aminopeptidase protein [Trichomonas vaginalis G3]EAX97879.1 Clan MH, family M18, aspartyl aminopeptidase-like metallopeptidase [Trichomonas vaginalis G3]KAI5501158.1 aminopeptidase protein [Trichomonas vaginalis G3]|eukprot:XP_001310809.1 Clan MH, family M18, aspartyl aminopeptidase-like metallopeptidase [Trichomonas vaginalis G3]